MSVAKTLKSECLWLLSNQIKQDLSKAAYGGKLFLALAVSWKGENPTCVYIPDKL